MRDVRSRKLESTLLLVSLMLLWVITLRYTSFISARLISICYTLRSLM